MQSQLKTKPKKKELKKTDPAVYFAFGRKKKQGPLDTLWEMDVMWNGE